VLLVADPQLVDPHTYPGRPWPLSSLTVRYTDRYLRHSYRLLQEQLQPDATLFLGDLFDGGREWGTTESSSPEKQYGKYGTQFWLKEYIRFSNIFLWPWPSELSKSPGEPTGRRLLASVPGNHDLGFAAGIQMPVKERFDAFFGPLNRVEITGNHSFVLLDTVSLSAMDQIDPKTGSSGAGDGSAEATASSKIWKPVEDFLFQAKSIRADAIEHYCESRYGRTTSNHHHLNPVVGRAEDDVNVISIKPPHTPLASSQFPTIVLSHVPLYRSGETNCGPMRERGTAIPLQAGYQYQNVLTPLISQDIVKHLTPEEITMIYSGDDHDYCEIEHSEFTGRIREITVKSMSWAMGIRRPGVQLVSLWNPVDLDKALSSDPGLSMPRDTVQNHLCLLPDQLGVFIRYAQALGVTVVVLLFGTIRFRPAKPDDLDHEHEKSDPLLPTSEPRESSKSISSCVQSGEADQYLSTRKSNTSNHGYGNIPASSRTSSPSKAPYIAHARNAWSSKDHDHDRKQRHRSPEWPTYLFTRLKRVPGELLKEPKTRWEYLKKSLLHVAVPVLGFYIYLLITA
jgi:ethanolamine phosphate phosphodiesterase